MIVAPLVINHTVSALACVPKEHPVATPREQDRLTSFHRVMNESSLREMQLAGNERVLDVGVGTGQLARALAHRVSPLGMVIAVDRDPEQLAAALRMARQDGECGLVDFRLGESAALPLTAHEHGSFDIVHSRFALEHSTQPQRVVSEMVRAARNGGRIILQDVDHSLLRLSREPEGFGALWQAYVRAFSASQCNPFVARDLVHLMVRAGARPTRTTIIAYSACSGAPDYWPVVEYLLGMIEGAKDRIVASNLMSGMSIDRAISNLRSWACRPDAALWFPTTWVEGVRQSGSC